MHYSLSSGCNVQYVVLISGGITIWSLLGVTITVYGEVAGEEAVEARVAIV